MRPPSPFAFLSFPASLIGVEGGNATRIGRFANYLRNLLPSNDPVVMEMASKAIGRLAMAGDTFTAEYVEFEVKRALEWLGADRNEGRRHAAVSACGEGFSTQCAQVPERQTMRGCSRLRHCASQGPSVCPESLSLPCALYLKRKLKGSLLLLERQP